MAGALRSASSDEKELLGQPNGQAEHRWNPASSIRKGEASGAESVDEIFWLHFGGRSSTSVEAERQTVDDYNARNTGTGQKRDHNRTFTRRCRRPAASGR